MAGHFPSKHPGTFFILYSLHSKPCHHWIGHLFMPNLEMLLCPTLCMKELMQVDKCCDGFKQERAEHSRSKYITLETTHRRTKPRLVVWIQDFTVEINMRFTQNISDQYKFHSVQIGISTKNF